jgi:uncharacterized protein YecE (DUF72 family)
VSVYSAEQLNELATNLCAVEAWLRESCTARHNDDMADMVEQAWHVIEDLYDERRAGNTEP